MRVNILETEQETIVATRNARGSQTDVSETTSRLDTSSRVISSRDTERGWSEIDMIDQLRPIKSTNFLSRRSQWMFLNRT